MSADAFAKWSSRSVSSERSTISRLALRGAKRISQRVITLTAKLTVIAPGWKRYSGQISRVLPARSTRQQACATMPLDFIERSGRNAFLRSLCDEAGRLMRGSLGEELPDMAKLVIPVGQQIGFWTGL